MATIGQEVREKQAEAERNVLRARVEHWINSCTKFDLTEEWDSGNVPRLKILIEIKKDNFHEGRLPRVAYGGEVHIDPK